MAEKNSLNLDWTKSLAKFIPGAATVLIGVYLLGFIIVGSYLDKFGIRSTEIFQFRYLSTGIIFLAIFAINAVIYLRSLHMDLTTKVERTADLLQRWLRDILIFIWFNTFIAALILRGTPTKLLVKNPILGVLVLFIVIMVLMEIRLKTTIEWIRDIVWVLLFLMLAIFFGISKYFTFLFMALLLQLFLLCAFDVEHTKLLKKFDLVEKRGFWIITIAFLLFMVLLSCHIFGYLLYDKVPRYFGGGEPLIVQLAIPDDDVVFFNRLGIGTEGNGLTPPLSLIHETDTEYYVLTSTSSQEPNAIGIPKNIVKAIILSR